MPSTAVATTSHLLAAYHRVVEEGVAETRRPEEEPWLSHLALKAFLHCASAIHLVQSPTRSVTLPIAVPDGGSVLVLCRASFECLLTMQTLFLGSPSQEQEGRLLVWKLGGALERRNLPARTEEQAATKAAEKAEADRLRTVVAENAWFQSLDHKIQRRVRGDTWKHGKSWVDLAVAAGMHRDLAQQCYTFLCCHAHSGALSTAQSGAMGGGRARHTFALSSLVYLQVPLATVARAYAQRFSRAYLARDAGTRDLLDRYATIGSDPP